ncbi:MAG: hypothetical protein IIA72_13995 [Proteobacteria bacterium]|nr:hypothetical protein [Pseudomonadota bacterium]
MQHFRDHHQGDLTLTDDLEISGLVSGTVTVTPGRYLLLHGMITDDLVVQKTARATIHGTVGGAVLNHDGDVEIFGMVGSIQDFGVRKASVDAHAVIKGSN